MSGPALDRPAPALRLGAGVLLKHAVNTAHLSDAPSKRMCTSNYKRDNCPQCGLLFSARNGKVGAHVIIIERERELWIVPLCADCNSEAKNVNQTGGRNTNAPFHLRTPVLAIRSLESPFI